MCQEGTTRVSLLYLKRNLIIINVSLFQRYSNQEKLRMLRQILNQK
jgi:hypothetical protein